MREQYKHKKNLSNAPNSPSLIGIDV